MSIHRLQFELIRVIRALSTTLEFDEILKITKMIAPIIIAHVKEAERIKAERKIKDKKIL